MIKRPVPNKNALARQLQESYLERLTKPTWSIMKWYEVYKMTIRRIPAERANRVRDTHIFLRSRTILEGELSTGWLYKVEKAYYTHRLIFYNVYVTYKRGGKTWAVSRSFKTLDVAKANIPEVQQEARKYYAYYIKDA